MNGRGWFGAILCGCGFLVMGGCGSSDSGTSKPVLNPPASIDVELCSRFDTDHGSQCVDCCHGAGFENASYAYKRQCTCGPILPHGIDKQLCAASSASADTCQACCTSANYDAGILNTVDPCICIGLKHADVCASVAPADDGCIVCCLNAGYLSMSAPAQNGGACVCRE